MTRTPPPELEFRAPDCSICGTETGVDGDSFWCEKCGATWDLDGRHGEWDDPDADQCPSVIQPWRDSDRAILRPLTFRCIWAERHDGNHGHPERIFGWSDADAEGLTA